VSLDGVVVPQLIYNSSSILVDVAAVDSTIDKCCGFSTVESEELVRISLDFLVGDF
jgi:hypothetical protein